MEKKLVMILKKEKLLPILIAYDRSNNKEKMFWKKVIEDLEQEKNDLKMR